MLWLLATLASSGSPTPPDWCFQPNAQGQLPVCQQTSDGTWIRTFPGTASATGFGFLPVLVVLGFVVGGLILVWKVSKARSLARQAGMSEGDATAMTLLTEDGLAATYLASNLRGQGTTAETAQPSRNSADRLTELKGLLDSGLIDSDEYDTRRQEIIDEI